MVGGSVSGAIPSMLFRWGDIFSRAESSQFEMVASFVRSGSSDSLADLVRGGCLIFCCCSFL
jgi:hypothetical protein